MLHASVASQLLVTVLTQPLPAVTSPRLFTVAPLQASLAVGAVNDGEAVQLIVAGAPALPIVGATSSIMVIVCDTVPLWLLHASVASQLLVTVLTQPLPAVTSPKLFTVAPLHASDAVGAVNDGEAVQLIVADAPALPIIGATSSIMVIVCDTVAL